MHKYIICLEPEGHYKSVSVFELMSFWSSEDPRCMKLRVYIPGKGWKWRRAIHFFYQYTTKQTSPGNHKGNFLQDVQSIYSRTWAVWMDHGGLANHVTSHQHSAVWPVVSCSEIQFGRHPSNGVWTRAGSHHLSSPESLSLTQDSFYQCINWWCNHHRMPPLPIGVSRARYRWAPW